MERIRCQALRWASDDFPGWVVVQLIDADDQHHLIAEKVPVLTAEPLGQGSDYPQELLIDCVVERIDADRAVVVLAHGIETEDGRSRFTIARGDLVG